MPGPPARVRACARRSRTRWESRSARFPSPSILLLLTCPRAAANGLSFIGGWLIGIAVPAILFVVLIDKADVTENDPAWLAAVEIGLGVAFYSRRLPSGSGQGSGPDGRSVGRRRRPLHSRALGGSRRLPRRRQPEGGRAFARAPRSPSPSRSGRRDDGALPGDLRRGRRDRRLDPARRLSRRAGPRGLGAPAHASVDRPPRDRDPRRSRDLHRRSLRRRRARRLLSREATVEQWPRISRPGSCPRGRYDSRWPSSSRLDLRALRAAFGRADLDPVRHRARARAPLPVQRAPAC